AAAVRVLGEELHPPGVLDDLGDRQALAEGAARHVEPALDVRHALVLLAVVLAALDADGDRVAGGPVVEAEVELLAVAAGVGVDGGAAAEALAARQREQIDGVHDALLLALGLLGAPVDRHGVLPAPGGAHDVGRRAVRLHHGAAAIDD